MAQGRSAVARVQCAAAVLVVSAFAACGGLDDRKVTRGAEAVAGRGGSGAGGSVGVGGSETNGGSENLAGSGFEGGAPSLEGAPRVVAVLPEDDAADVDSLASVQVRFSEALDEATVTSDSVQVLRGDQPVPGALSYEEGTVTFEPDERLALLAEYEVRVSQAVTDAGGQPLEAAFSSTFSVREGTWTREEPLIEPLAASGYLASEVALGVDGAGNALTAWVEQAANTAPTLQVRWRRPSSGWEDATSLYTAAAPTGPLLSVNVAVSRAGEAAVAWFDQTPNGYALWVARYVDGAWERPQRAEGASGVTATSFPPGAPLLAINHERTIVAWLRQEFVGGDIGTYYFLEANDAAHGQPFEPQAKLAAANQGGIGNFFGQADLGMDASGNALLVFSDHVSDVGTVHYSKFAASTRAWSFDAPIEGASPVRTGPFIRMSPEGTAVVVYEAGNDVKASSYTKARGFSAPMVLDELGTQPYLTSASPIATDGRQFLVTWQQLVGSTANAYATILTDGAWSAAELVSDGDVSGSTFPVPAADPNGNLTVFWSQGAPPNFDVYFARRPSGASAWQSPAELSVSMPRPYGSFRAAAATNGLIGLAMTSTLQSGSGGQTPEPFFALFQ